MSRINNTIKTVNNITTVLVTKDSDPKYLKEVILDSEDWEKLGKIRVNKKGYAWANSKPIAHTVLNHTSNMTTVIDHINGNKLDNRKKNLRVLAQADNANNRNISKNNTGVVGIALRSNGNYEYYRCTVSDRRDKVISGITKSACKKYTKQFNVNTLGKEVAFEQAKNWLKLKRKEFGYIE